MCLELQALVREKLAQMREEMAVREATEKELRRAIEMAGTNIVLLILCLPMFQNSVERVIDDHLEEVHILVNTFVIFSCCCMGLHSFAHFTIAWTGDTFSLCQ